VEFDGIDGVYVTYKTDNSTIVHDATKNNGSVSVGLAVKISTHKTVALAEDGNQVEGKLIQVEPDNKGVVQVGGYCKLPGGDGATLTPGNPFVGALGAASAKGYIRMAAATAGAYAQATATDIRNARGAIVDSTTASATVVRL
jgi:hypothetical protein